jgi:hypothetical protein
LQLSRIQLVPLRGGHHRATSGPARWQESAGTTDDYVELAESPVPKPRAREDDEELRALQLRERRLEGGGYGGAGEPPEDQREQRRRRSGETRAGDDAAAAAAAAPSTSEEHQQHTPAKSSWRETMREYADGLKSSPNASGEFDKEMEEIDEMDEIIEDPLGRGPASVSWASPPPSSSRAHPDAVRGFSPVGSVGSSVGADSAAKRQMPPSPFSPMSSLRSKGAGGRGAGAGGGGAASLGGSWDAVGQRLGSPVAPAGGGGGGGGKRLDYGGGGESSLRQRVAEEQAQRARRARMAVDRELAPGEIICDDSDDDDDDDGGGGRGAGRGGLPGFTPIAFGA